GGDEGAGEAPAAVDRFAGSDPDPPAEKALEVLGLGQRAVGARRADLERVLLEEVAQGGGHALAELEVDAARAVEVETERLGGRALQHHELDLRVDLGKPALDCRLQFLQLLSLSARDPAKKRWARAHLHKGSGAVITGLSIAAQAWASK